MRGGKKHQWDPIIPWDKKVSHFLVLSHTKTGCFETDGVSVATGLVTFSSRVKMFDNVTNLLSSLNNNIGRKISSLQWTSRRSDGL